MNCIHPEYGNFEYNVWKPLYFHKTNKKTGQKEFGINHNYHVMVQNNKNTPITVKNVKRNKTISSHFGRYVLSHNGVNNSYSELHIAIASLFPHITPKDTIDHINDDPTDNRITNLMWMERSENSKKGQKKAIKNSNTNGGRRGKYVTMRKPDLTDKNNRDKSIPIGLFRSAQKCAHFIIENVICNKSQPSVNTVASKIRRAISTPNLKAYGYYYDTYEIKQNEEEWKQHPQFRRYKISTQGRFRNSHGIISQQKKMRNGSKYSYVSCNNKNEYIHKLVWETWIGPIPEGMDIMHDDTAPLQEDGSYRNWLCDLSIGTRKENMEI